MIIYFKRARDIFGIKMREERIALLSKRPLTENSREQWNLIIRNKGEKRNFQGNKGTCYLFPIPGAGGGGAP